MIELDILNETETPLLEKSTPFEDISITEEVTSSVIVNVFGSIAQCASVLETTMHFVVSSVTKIFEYVLPILKCLPFTTTVVGVVRDRRSGVMVCTVGRIVYTTVLPELVKSCPLLEISIVTGSFDCIL